ncbi:MAG: hypothetical protein LDL37_05135 [Asticcacaulis sp.]|uniref:hypothetical protein n=1 Tax=Asticcacaulis sp. TaxID=1872648 RepID=UPI0025BE348D|nr:hypothetical protein [Asticcacaulis sp.]MCA1934813.1 hypothetical protein [Asticcacaulis sp.]
MDGLRILTDKHVGGAIIHALALLYTLFAAYWVHRKPDWNEPVEAQIVWTSDGGSGFAFLCRFHDPSGKRHYFPFVFTSPQTGFAVGQSVRIVYCKRTPLLCYLETERAAYTRLVTLCALVLTLLMLLSLVKRL